MPRDEALIQRLEKDRQDTETRLVAALESAHSDPESERFQEVVTELTKASKGLTALVARLRSDE